MRRKPLVALLLTATGSLVLAGVATAADTGLRPVDPDGPGANGIEDIYWLLVGIVAFIAVTVFVPLAYFIIRYRSNGRGRDVEGPQVRGNTQLELGWTIGAVLIIAVLAAFTFYKLTDIVDPASASGDAELTVLVQGRQFYWQFEYPGEVIAIDELRIPVDRVTKFEVTAPDGDVIHSFWVPALAGKRDAIPGQETSFKVLPTRTGRHEIICGEFCGLQHAIMRGSVEVVPGAEFDSWLAEQRDAQAAGESDLGQQIWERACAKCHGPEYAGEVGPELAGNSLLGDPDAIERLVRNGQGAMPAVGQDWSDRQMKALTDYLRDDVAKGGGSGDQS